MARSWALLLIIFLFIYLAAQAILAKEGLTSFNEAVTGLVSLLLTSFVLVFMRDAITSEQNRRRKLERQFTIYEKIYESTLEAISSLMRSVELAEPSYSDWRYWESFNLYLRQLPLENPISCNDARSLYGALERLSEASRQVEAWYIEDTFIDASPTSADRSLMYWTNSIKSTASEMMRLTANTTILEVQPSELSELINSSFYMVSTLRRPWRYSNDQAKKKLLIKFLDEHGVELQ